MSYYTHRIIAIICFLFLLTICSEINAQSISGVVLNEENEPIPYANIYIRELQTGTSTDIDGKYFLTIDEGEYELVITSLGYGTKTMNIVVGDLAIQKNILLESAAMDLEEIVVKASKKDPAYAIIQKAVDHRKLFLTQINSFKSEVYVKATETIDKKERKKREAKKEVVEVTTEADPVDIFEEEEKKKKKSIEPNLNMVEMNLTLNYQSPDNYKEERTGYKLYGKKAGLYIPQFSEADFNFYENLVYLKGIAETPIISPISRTAILSYKYKLIESVEESGVLVHKIKVIPRKTGNSTCSGHIYINEGIWNINRLDLKIEKGGLTFFDALGLKLDYEQLEDSLWIVNKQEFEYETKQGRFKTFRGNTLIRYSDFQKDVQFPKKFFGNEVAVTTKEAYERDSSYWKDLRPEPLTKEELRAVFYRDSVEAVVNSQEYKDSIQAKYNKVTFLEILWDGLGFRNNEKKQHIYVGSLAAMIEFDIVGGFRLGPYLSYFRRWENGKMFNTSGQINMGFTNKDVQGFVSSWHRYNPYRLGDISGGFGRSFESINSYDAFLNQLKASNYILHDEFELGHRIELFNGFYVETDLSFSDRKSIDGYNTSSFIDKIVEDDGTALVFDDYQALISKISLAYTPRQKFMTEPNRKVVLGSRFPTFRLTHKKGWNKLLTSDIDFDYLQFSVEQDVILGVFGTSKYTAKIGKFINTKDLKFIDLKRFRQSDPYLYSNPLHSFQLLDTSIWTTNYFFELHHIHHFNGALVNNIPLVKKLRIRAVAGAGFLWIQDSQYRHEEVFAGLERVFKLGPRRRLRLGVYGVLAESNYTKPQTGIKFSVDIIDTWKKDWSF